MADDPQTEPLRRWNQLARENTENAIVSSMFEATWKASKPLENFSTWLLVGVAAVASFLITNSDKVLPLLGSRGFLSCGILLCLSCIFGLLSKIFALQAQIGIETALAVRQTFAQHLARYEEEEKEIKESAKFWGIDLQTGVRLERVLSEFFKPMPKWMAWLATRQLKKHAGNPQVGHLLLVRRIQKQGYFAALQALAFLGFMISGFVYATPV